MVGFLGARGHVDESFIRSIMGAAVKQEAQRRKRLGISQRVPSPKLCIMDARGYSSAIANGVHGGGHENPDNYLNASITFMSLANIHVIAASHQSLLKAIIMDPYFRTIRGLRALIEKEWLFCGHPFQARNDCQQPRSGKHHAKNLHQDSSTPPSAGNDRGTEGWVSGGPPVLLSSPNGKSERLSAIPNLSSFAKPNWMKAAIGDDGGDSSWTTPPMRISNPFSRGSNNSESRRESTQSLPSSRADIAKSEYASPLPLSTAEEASDMTHESFIYSSPSRLKPKAAKDGRATPGAAAAAQGESTTTAAGPSPSIVQPKVNPSPVFLLFLTCLHHILQQHPDQFEYNDYLLLLLAKAASGFSAFGDFLFNTERERAQARLRENTVSVWAWIDRHRGLVTNAGYTPPPPLPPTPPVRQRQGSRGGDRGAMSSPPSHPTSSSMAVLQVQTGGRYISIWSEYYFDALASAGSHPLDPVTLLASSPMFHPHAPTSRARRNLASDFWHASLLATVTTATTVTATMATKGGERGLLPPMTAFHLTMPPMSPGATAGLPYDVTVSRPLQNHETVSKSAAAATQQPTPTTIEQYLDYIRLKHVRDQYDEEYRSLAPFLRRKRLARAREVFEKWAMWAKKEKKVKAAKEAGWVVTVEGGGGVGSSGEAEDSSLLPMLVARAGRRALMVEMEQILDTSQEAFFGQHPVVIEEYPSEEGSSEQDEVMELDRVLSPHPKAGEEEEDEDVQQTGTQQRMGSIYSEDGFDDLGFPVVPPSLVQHRRL
ncbi:Myotubularin- protein 2 [Actinomortierella ambigua]|nr:Myotubularin- protein 2 [Actinomortierella ambigua]